MSHRLEGSLHTLDRVQQLLLVAGRDGGDPEVVGEVEAGVVHPCRRAQTSPWKVEHLAEPRNVVQPAFDRPADRVQADAAVAAQ